MGYLEFRNAVIALAKMMHQVEVESLAVRTLGMEAVETLLKYKRREGVLFGMQVMLNDCLDQTSSSLVIATASVLKDYASEPFTLERITLIADAYIVFNGAKLPTKSSLLTP